MRSIPTALALLLLTSSAGANGRKAIEPELLRFSQQRPGSPIVSSEFAGSPGTPGAPVPDALYVEDGLAFAEVWIGGNVDPAAVRDLGGRVNTVAGGFMTARIPLAAVSRLVALPGLERVQLAQRVDLQADMMVKETGVDDLWGGLPPSFPTNAITGRNVVIGIVDTGIDPYHRDFWSGSSPRIKFVWDQSVSTGPLPSGFAYGTQYTSAQISSRTCPITDTNGHGTHMAGVAAGNGGGTANGQPAYRYPGEAPEADLVIVKLKTLPNGTITDDKVLDGVRYVFERAASLGKPAVVVLSLGKTTGPHDGDDPLDLGISALTGPGKIVCAAAGNFGGESRHAEWTQSGTQPGSITLTIPTYASSSVAADIVEIEAWYGQTANFDVTVVTPLGQQVGPVARGAATEVNTAAGIVSVGNGTYTSAGGAYRLSLQLYRGSLTYPQLAAGTWTLRFTPRTVGSHRVDSWITYYALGSVKPKFVTGMTERCLVASPASANNVTSVAAYSTRRYWTAVDGRTYFMADATVGALAKFSSPGPRRDGLEVPDLAAPGYSVASSRSSATYPSTMYLMTDSVHVIGYGTSVAAASVAGTVALKLQSYPNMAPDQASSIRFGSLADTQTGPVPNNLWGWGKLRAPLAVAAVGDAALGSQAISLASRNPAHGSVSFDLALARAELKADTRVRILDVSGRQVASLPVADAGSQRVTWQGRTTQGAAAVAGMYWAQLNAGGKTWTRSFVWLR